MSWSAAAVRQTSPDPTAGQIPNGWDSHASHQARREEVTVWWAILNEHQRPEPERLLLSMEEARRASRMPDPDARDRWVNSRTTLRTILSGYLGVDALAVPITYGSLGKPALANLSPVRFNLSHSAELAAFAVTWRRPIGIDVQRLGAGDQIGDLAPWTLSERAYEDWLRLPEHKRRLAFTRTWVRKEAYLKGLGLGLVHPLRDLEVVGPSGSGALRIIDKHAAGSDVDWRVFDLVTPDPGFVAAVAVKGEVSSLISRGWPDGNIRATWRSR